MCGIVAAIAAQANGFSREDIACFADMLYMDALRGWDATGIMYGDDGKNVQIHKQASPAPLFMSTKEWSGAKQDLYLRGRWIVGHNRAATRGDKKNDANAHPFVVDDKIILVQNGTYRGDHKHHKNVEVDSEACAHVIAEEPDISKALKKIDAAYAFIWYNVETQTLHIIRNTERPLHIGYTDDGNIFLSSEAGILEAAAQRNGIKFKTRPFLLKDGQLGSIKMMDAGIEEWWEDIDITYEAPRFRQQQNHHALASPDWGKVTRSVVENSTPWLTGGSSAMDWIGDLRVQDRCEFTMDGVVEVRKRINRTTSDELIIQGIDYFPVHTDNLGNASVTNRKWWVFGKLIWTEQTQAEFEGLNCVWCVDNKSEEEVIALSTKTWIAEPDYINVSQKPGFAFVTPLLYVNNIKECVATQ